jgi:hypothetical protein
MRNQPALQDRALALIEQLRQALTDPGFCLWHRRRPADFTRQCVLTFPVLMLLLLQKSLKSLQAHLQEFLGQVADGAVAPQLRSREKMVYGNEVLHKTLSGAIGASRLKLLGRIGRKPARLPPIWGFRPFPMILGSF